MVTAGLDQLRGDAQAVAGPADAAAQYIGGAQFCAHLGRGHRLVAVGEHGRTREDAQPLNVGQLGDDVLGHAIAKILIFLGAAQVLEVKNSD